jgi:hypothetical protein
MATDALVPGPGVGDTALRRLLALALAAGLLYVSTLAITRLPCWALFPLLVPTAWLLWGYWAGNALFARRLWLTGVTRDESRVRRWLIRGWLVQALTALPALVFSALLLAIAALLAPEHWLLLALDVLLLSLVIGPLQRRLAGEVQADKAGFVARRWPLLLGNLLLLAAAFLVVDFAVLGGPDTRGQAWHAVAESAFTAAGADAVCPAAGWLVGALAAVEALAWHASLLVIPSLPEPVLRLGAWVAFLAQAGFFAWLFTSMLLGTLALVEARRVGQGEAASRRPAGTLSAAFLYTILLLAVPYLYAVHKLRTFDPTMLESQAREVLAWTNPCRADPGLAALSGELDSRLQSARAEALAAADARIDRALDAFFRSAEQGVDAYLDWYFTVLAEYQRLAAVAAGDFGALMADQLNRHLFEDTGFEAWLADTTAALDADADTRTADLASGLGRQLRAAAAASDCTVELLDGPGLAAALGDPLDLRRDATRAGASAAAGAAAGALTVKMLSKQVAGAVAAKLAAKESLQAAAALAGKAAAKKGGSTLASALGATAICAPSGPWAVLCGIGAGAATWLAVDKVMIEVDEARLREDMRADLLATLQEQRGTLAALLHQRQSVVVDARLEALAERLGRRYVPARE